MFTEPLPPQTRACAIDALGSSPDRFAQACSAIHCCFVYVFMELRVSSSVSHQWLCTGDAPLPSSGSRWPRFPAFSGTIKALRLPAVNGGVDPRISGEQRASETTRCRAGHQEIASRQAASRLLRCAPALRVT